MLTNPVPSEARMREQRMRHGARVVARRRAMQAEATESLRVALLAPTRGHGPRSSDVGIAAVVSALATGLLRRGHQVTLMNAPPAASVVATPQGAGPSETGEVDPAMRVL